MGQQFFEASEKEHILEKYFKGAFNDLDSIMDLVPDWVWQSWNSAALDVLPPIDAQLVRSVILGFSKAKTLTKDGIVVEMLMALDDENLTTLAEIFSLRAFNHASEKDDTAWREHVVNLIMKKAAPKMPSDLRPIVMLPVVLKVYCATLLLFVERLLDDISEWQFAFRPRWQCHEVIFVLRNLAEKTSEWKIPIFRCRRRSSQSL